MPRHDKKVYEDRKMHSAQKKTASRSVRASEKVLSLQQGRSEKSFNSCASRQEQGRGLLAVAIGLANDNVCCKSRDILAAP